MKDMRLSNGVAPTRAFPNGVWERGKPILMKALSMLFGHEIPARITRHLGATDEAGHDQEHKCQDQAYKNTAAACGAEKLSVTIKKPERQRENRNGEQFQKSVHEIGLNQSGKVMDEEPVVVSQPEREENDGERHQRYGFKTLVVPVVSGKNPEKVGHKGKAKASGQIDEPPKTFSPTNLNLLLKASFWREVFSFAAHDSFLAPQTLESNAMVVSDIRANRRLIGFDLRMGREGTRVPIRK